MSDSSRNVLYIYIYIPVEYQASALIFGWLKEHQTLCGMHSHEQQGPNTFEAGVGVAAVNHHHNSMGRPHRVTFAWDRI
jgi:hypothetical protein